MQVMHVNNKTLSNLRNRLTLDYVCWTGAAIAVWYYSIWYNFPIVSALVGATGFMYLKIATSKFILLKDIIKQAELFADEIEKQLLNMSEEEKETFSVTKIMKDGEEVDGTEEDLPPEIKSFLDRLEEEANKDDSDQP